MLWADENGKAGAARLVVLQTPSRCHSSLDTHFDLRACARGILTILTVEDGDIVIYMLSHL